MLQNIALRKCLNALPFVSNYILHTYLKLNTINEETKCFYRRFHNCLNCHTYPLVQNLAFLTILGDSPRRLK